MTMLKRLLKFLTTGPTVNGGSSLAPHERWPEVLHWQTNDVFEVNYREFHLEMLTSDGYAYGWEGIIKDYGRKAKRSIGSLVGHNRSYRDRCLRIEQASQSADYMELIKQFNVAFKELQERDRRNGVNQ